MMAYTSDNNKDRGFDEQSGRRWSRIGPAQRTRKPDQPARARGDLEDIS
jgi:hypothetical protein